MPSLSLLHACRVSRSLRPQSASCSILALRSPYACFYLILAILNYFNLSSVFILNYHAFYSLLYFNFFCLILTDAAPTCLECPRGRVAVYREREKKEKNNRRSILSNTHFIKVKHAQQLVCIISIKQINYRLTRVREHRNNGRRNIFT